MSNPWRTTPSIRSNLVFGSDSAFVAKPAMTILRIPRVTSQAHPTTTSRAPLARKVSPRGIATGNANLMICSTSEGEELRTMQAGAMIS